MLQADSVAILYVFMIINRDGLLLFGLVVQCIC